MARKTTSTYLLVTHLKQSQIQDFPKGGPLSCEVPSRRDSVGGRGVVAEYFSVISIRRRVSVGGGGVVVEFFSALQNPTRFSGGGGSR